MTTGERIRQRRQLAGLTQKELGIRAGIAEPTIGRYELGKLNPKPETLKKIARALAISWYELLPDSEINHDLRYSTKFVADDKVIADRIENALEPQTLEKTGEKDSSYAIFEKIATDYNKLNITGKQKAAERVQELTEIPKYKASK